MISRAILLLFILFLAYIDSFSQPMVNSKNARPEKRLWELENYSVITCIRSPRLEKMISDAEDAEKKDTGDNMVFRRANIKLPATDFALLSPSDKFIYAHQYPESYMQVCGLYDIQKGMSKICANIPYLFDGMRMSERQRQSLRDNRDSTFTCLEKCINFDSHIPLGYKQTIMDINGWEFIPSILSMEDKINKGVTGTIKDVYVYSLLMLLMKNNDFSAFKETGIYKRLYGADCGYRAKIDLTVTIRKELVRLADDFYKWKLAGKPITGI